MEWKQRIFTKHILSKGLERRPAVKGPDCSCTRPRFGSQHPFGASQVRISNSSSKIQRSRWDSSYTGCIRYSTYIHTYKRTYLHISMIGRLLLLRHKKGFCITETTQHSWTLSDYYHEGSTVKIGGALFSLFFKLVTTTIQECRRHSAASVVIPECNMLAAQLRSFL